MERLREARRDAEGLSVLQLLEAAQRPPLVVLDDLGAERIWHAPGETAAESFVAENLYKLINYRYEHALPMVVTSNQDPMAMEQRIGVRVVDRLLEMCQPIRMSGESWRVRLRRQAMNKEEEP